MKTMRWDVENGGWKIYERSVDSTGRAYTICLPPEYINRKPGELIWVRPDLVEYDPIEEPIE